MKVPGASRYWLDYYGDDRSSPYILSARQGLLEMTPNSQGAVTLVCDDGVRRCKTVRQWALLCEREGEEG